MKQISTNSKTMRWFMLAIVGCMSLQGCATGLFKKTETQSDTAASNESESPVYDQMMLQSYLDEFGAKVCGFKKPGYKQSKKAQDSCYSKWKETFIARLNQEYPYASGPVIDEYCKAYPIECSDPKNYEAIARRNHLARLQAATDSRNRELANQRAQENYLRAVQLQNLGNALSGAATAFQQDTAPAVQQPVVQQQPMQQFQLYQSQPYRAPNYRQPASTLPPIPTPQRTNCRTYAAPYEPGVVKTDCSQQ